MEVLRTAILETLRRKKGRSMVSTSGIVKQMYPEDWELFLDEVNAVAIEMCKEGLISIIPENQALDMNSFQAKPLLLSSAKNHR